ncbi:MAG: 4-hydroxythreonine-4-phosphate dehydrogenase PdxA [Gemmatimonadota bacterium]
MTQAAGDSLPRLGICLGDPRGIGPEIVEAALTDCGARELANFRVAGASGAVGVTDSGIEAVASLGFQSVGAWDFESATGEAAEILAGELAGRSIETVVQWALAGEVDGIVTGPISKQALRAAGYSFPGHTELLQKRTGAEDVAMIMAAETTPLGGPLRIALVTVHVPLSDVTKLLTPALVASKACVAVGALREWWGIAEPRIALAGVNPHASEGGLFGDEEARILEPAAEMIRTTTGARVTGVFPADTVFRLCLEGRVDLVVTPYHDVGLAVLKTLASETGVNVTAGLPFPRTSPDHGTAFDIAGQGLADAGSMTAAVELCARFCQRVRAGA